jgi:hypothetical protein
MAGWDRLVDPVVGLTVDKIDAAVCKCNLLGSRRRVPRKPLPVLREVAAIEPRLCCGKELVSKCPDLAELWSHRLTASNLGRRTFYGSVGDLPFVQPPRIHCSNQLNQLLRPMTSLMSEKIHSTNKESCSFNVVLSIPGDEGTLPIYPINPKVLRRATLKIDFYLSILKLSTLSVCSVKP